jgi:magnesium transporter
MSSTSARLGALARPVLRLMTRLSVNGGAPDLPATAHAPGAWMIACGVYAGGRRVARVGDYRRAPALARRHRGFVWLGLREPTMEQFAPIASAFGIHDLAARQAVMTSQRPKVERHGSVTMFALRTTRYVEHRELTETSEVVETGEILIFIGDWFVVTVRHGAPGELSSLRHDLEQRPDLLRWGPWAVAYAICDQLVDTYLAVADGIEADLENIEDQVFARATTDRIAHIYQLKRELVEFRRAVAPLQRPLAELIDEASRLPRETRRYLRDVHDHLLRVVERVNSYDELLNSVLAARLAQVSVMQNNDMRKIAAWAAIAAMQTAIAGLYGMNFTHMPGVHWEYGYPAVLGVMVVGAVVLYRAFRRSGWL